MQATRENRLRRRPVPPPRCPSRDAPIPYHTNQQDSHVLISTKEESPLVSVRIIEPNNSRDTVSVTPGEPRQRPNLRIDTDIPFQSHQQTQTIHESKARAPWAQPTDFTPHPSNRSVTAQKDDGRLAEPSPESQQDNYIRDIDRLTFQNLSIASSNDTDKTPRTPRKVPFKTIIQVIRKFSGKVGGSPHSPKTGGPLQTPPRYVLKRNQHGQVPLLTLQHKRYLELVDPLQDVHLHAKNTLQAFRPAYTRDLPELRFPRGQDQIDVVVGYLMRECARRLEDSPTTGFVRHSHESLRAWSGYLNPDEPQQQQRQQRHQPSSPGNTRAEKWNVIEARRRIRRLNRIIDDFNECWDNWVAEQSREIRVAARRIARREEITDATRSPFRLYYHYMLIAADAEIEQRKDIAEALILQYPNAFPGFMKVHPEKKGGRAADWFPR